MSTETQADMEQINTDLLTPYLRPGLHLISGQTGVGKSTLATQIVNAIAATGARILSFADKDSYLLPSQSVIYVDLANHGCKEGEVVTHARNQALVFMGDMRGGVIGNAGNPVLEMAETLARQGAAVLAVIDTPMRSQSDVMAFVGPLAWNCTMSSVVLLRQ
ncbi:hypothetical protein ACMHYO_12025 [Allopusillimonas ginsengisoli]|uniref:hypothetical protein n=1 Tax=Allopusillimonas ginsengisoli TaxID=453575 RepID=UPI0039C23A63